MFFFFFLAALEPALEPTRLGSGGEPAAGAAACSKPHVVHVVPRCVAFISWTLILSLPVVLSVLSPSLSLPPRDIFGSNLTAETKWEDV